MKPAAYHRPKTLQEAWRLKDQIPGSRFIAGGTDLMVRIKNRQVRPPALISLRGVPDLNGIRQEGITRVGALTTITDLIQHQGLGQQHPLLIEAARRLGSTQIRNAATIGGNLCNASPCADTATALLALEARLEIEGSQGRRVLPLSEFFRGPGQTDLGPGEVLMAILLDPPPAARRVKFLKKGRVRMDMALASVAIAAEVEGGRCLKACLAAGSVAPTPLRLRSVEQLLAGALPSHGLLAEAAKLACADVSPIDDLRASADYRRHLIGVYVARALQALLAGTQP